MSAEIDPSTMERMNAPAALRAIRAGRKVYALALKGSDAEWDEVASITRHKAQAGHTYYVVEFVEAPSRTFQATGVFSAERVSDG
jgi:hypothetical protein